MPVLVDELSSRSKADAGASTGNKHLNAHTAASSRSPTGTGNNENMGLMSLNQMCG